MPWFSFALLSMLFASFYALVQKHAMNCQIGVFRWLAQTFIVTFMAFAFYTFVVHHEFSGLIGKLQSPTNLLLALVVGGFTFAGNIFYVRAVDKSPNPAYPEGVNLFAIPLTLVASVIFLGSPIAWTKTVGILVVILGLFLLTFERGQTQTARGDWKPSSFLAMICFGLLFVAVKAMSDRGFAPEETLTTLFFFAGLGFLIACPLKLISLRLKGLPSSIIVAVILAALLSFIDNLMQFTSIKLSSNPAYPTTIYNSSALLVLFLSPLVFPKEAGGEFNLKRWLGVVITVAGVAVVVLG